MNKNLELGITFFKIGLFTFGGGLSMIPMIENELVTKKKWINEEDMMDMIAIAEATPGVIAVNSATFIGYKINKFWGAFFSTLCVVLPSFLVILLITLFMEQFLAFDVVSAAFMGIRCGVALLIFKASIKMFKKLKKNFLAYSLILFAIAVSLLFPNISTIYILMFGGIVGILDFVLKVRRKASDDKC